MVSGLAAEELKALGLSDKPIGSKVLFLKAAASRLKEAELREQVKSFCAAIEETKVARNHVFHGIWGWRGDNRTETVFAAARKSSNPGQPFKATQLPALEKRLCRCSRLGSDLFMHYMKPGFRLKHTRFLHHGGKKAGPQWLQQWTARNPLDGAALDRSAKGGQLPRLDALAPRK
jgi:hypothetical protein